MDTAALTHTSLLLSRYTISLQQLQHHSSHTRRLYFTPRTGFNMVGTFERDEERCHHYAAFASHLGRQAFDYIYWFLFGLVIMMLFLASWKYSRDFEAAQKFESGSRHYRNRMKKCMLICSIYASISVVAVVMEVYALMALQFCDGEDLMSLYWSTWTMMQVGSLIAILGILLSVFNGLRGNKNP